MSQQINLFNPIFLKQKKYFSTYTMLQSLCLLLLGAGLVAGYATYEVSRLDKEAAQTATQLEQAKKNMLVTDAQFQPRQPNAELQAQVHKAEAELLSLKQVAGILDRGEFGNTKGYSPYLRAFSQQIIDGVWLTGVTITGAGNEIGLKGRALKPELVPVYISRLKREPVMTGKSFATLEMQVPQLAVEATAVTSAASEPKSAGPQRTLAPYIEFSLQSSLASKEPIEQVEVKPK